MEVDSPHGEHDHSTTEPKIREVLASVGLSSSGLEWIESYSHSAWRTDEVVVRYRIIGPTGRLIHEAAVGRLLPVDALYPEVVAAGCWGRDDWLVTARIRGIPLVDAWPTLSDGLRERATHELGVALRAVHRAPVRQLQPPCLYGGAPVIARDRFIDELVAAALRGAGTASTREVDRVVQLLEDARNAIDDVPSVMAHGDFGYSQGLWNNDHLVGLVDLEMSHAEAPDWDLPSFLGFSSERTNTSDVARCASWLNDVYPELFAHPDLALRLRVYAVVYGLNGLMENPDVRLMSAILETGPGYDSVLQTMRQSP